MSAAQAASLSMNQMTSRPRNCLQLALGHGDLLRPQVPARNNLRREDHGVTCGEAGDGVRNDPAEASIVCVVPARVAVHDQRWSRNANDLHGAHRQRGSELSHEGQDAQKDVIHLVGVVVVLVVLQVPSAETVYATERVGSFAMAPVASRRVRCTVCTVLTIAPMVLACGVKVTTPSCAAVPTPHAVLRNTRCSAVGCVFSGADIGADD